MVSISNFTGSLQMAKYVVNFTYTDDFDFPYVSFRINLDAPPERPFIQKALVKCLPGVRSGGRLAKPHPPATDCRSRWPANVERIAIKKCSLARRCDFPRLAQDAHPDGRDRRCQDEWPAPLRGPGDARPETKPRARGGFGVTTIDFRTDPVTARRHRVVSLVTHADIPDIVWADDETGCYGVRGRDAKGNRIVVEQSGPIRIVSARR